MKKSALLFIIILSISVFSSLAQDKGDWGVPIDAETNTITYTGVVQVDGVSKAELFTRAYSWLKEFYVAVDKKIYTKDKEAGKIELNAHIQIYRMDKKTKVKDALIKFKIELLFKDGKYKYTLYKFITTRGTVVFNIEKWMDEKYATQEDAQRRFSNLNSEMEKLIASMKSSLSSAPVEKNDDW